MGRQQEIIVDMLPCPFCGKSAAKTIEDFKRSFIVECQHCRATSRRIYSGEAAAKEWNKRIFRDD